MELSDRPSIHRQGIKNIARHFLFLLSHRTEPLCNAIIGRAEIANATGLLTVGQIAEMPHQTRHSAVVALGVANHGLDLALLLFALRDVRIAPLIVTLAIRPA